ncbi:MAG: hypothetical protein J6Y60_05450 [Treponema sp.]|nr:hypothetical protein [Treponema sp.]
MTVADFKISFSSLLSKIQMGSSKKRKRVLGTYEGKAKFSELGDGKISLV